MTQNHRIADEMLANRRTSPYTFNNSVEHLYNSVVLCAKNFVVRRVAKRDDSDLPINEEEKAAVTLRLPSTLSAYSGGKSQIVLHANTVAEMLQDLHLQHPQVWGYLCDEQGHIREHVKMFVSNQMVSGSGGLTTKLKPGQEIIVLPAFFGV